MSRTLLMHALRRSIGRAPAHVGRWFWLLVGLLHDTLTAIGCRSVEGARRAYAGLPRPVRVAIDHTVTVTEAVLDRTPAPVRRVLVGVRRGSRALAVPRSERERERRRVVVLSLPFFVLAIFGALIPLGYLARMSVSADNLRIDGFTTEAWRTVLTESTYHWVAFNTLWFAALTALVSVVLGVAVSHALERYALPFENLLVALISFPIALPGIVVAFLVIVLLGRQGLATNLVAFVSAAEPSNHATASVVGLFVGYVYSLLPRATMVMRGTYASVNTEAEEAARALGATPFETFYHVTLPEIRPGIVGAFVLTFRTALAIFGTVLVLGGLSVATLQIDRELAIGFDSQVAAVIGIAYFAFILAVTFVGLRFTTPEVVEG